MLNRQDFLKMPEGTFFAKGEKWVINGFCVKQKTFSFFGKPYGFVYHNLIDFEYEPDEDYVENCEIMLRTGKSMKINKTYTQDGCFACADDKDVFLVFEKGDLEYIKSLILTSLMP